MMKNILLFVAIVNLQFADGFTYQKVYKSTEICGVHSGHRKYLELGESGEILAHNITIPEYVKEVSKKFNQSLTMQCSLELVTCPSCMIKINFEYLNFPSNCANPKNGAGICRCDYLILSEPPYTERPKNLLYNCGDVSTYQSKTRSVHIRFVYWNNYSDAFRMEYSVEQNRHVITSTIDDSSELDSERTSEIVSPFFPSYYPRDFNIEYVLKCESEACRIRIEFSDFQIARSSVMEFFDSNGEKFFANGVIFRPPILMSSGPRVTVRFNANGGSDLGYKAKVTFLSLKEAADTEIKPQTNCGGLVETVGGAITMMNMLNNNGNDTDSVLYDCIWIIRPPTAYLQTKTHLSIRVDRFENMAADSEISIHQGTTSDRPILEVVRSSPGTSISSRNLIVPLASGFYVHFYGKFNSRSRLAIIYTAFSYSKCYSGNEFMCQNQRCIPLTLKCDTFDHCNDNSDEPESCREEWEKSAVDRQWYAHTPNYYFPKSERFTELRSTTLVYLICSLSILFVITCMLVTIYRGGRRAREQEEFQNQLQTISQLLDVNNNNRPDDQPVEPPPIYEAPPSYGEIIKIGMDDEINQIKKDRRSGRKSRLHRPRRSDPAVSVQSALLESAIADNSDLPSTSSMGSPSPYYSGNKDNFLTSVHMLDIEEAIETSTQGKGVSRGCQTSTWSLSQDLSCTSLLEAPEGSTPNSCHESVNHATSSLSPQLINESSSEVSRANHLWQNENKCKRSWIQFSSDDFNGTHMQSIDDTMSVAQMKEVDEYFKSYADSKERFQSHSEDSFVSMKSCFCDSAQSIFSDKFKTSLLANKLQCDRCKNLIYQQGNRHCSMCGDCVERLYSQKMCVACNGRISFQDLKNIKIVHNKESTEGGEIVIKLCNCFPKYPSQNFSSIQPNEVAEIQTLPNISGKSCSYNELFHNGNNNKIKKAKPFFASHNCLPVNASSSDSESCDSDDEH